MAGTKKEVNFKGTVRFCTYNTENYKVYAVDIDIQKYPQIKLTKYGNCTIYGNLHDLDNDQLYEITAIEETNKYGYGYKVVNIKRDKPHNSADIYSFLCEILTLNQASQLWEHYPDIIERVLEDRCSDIDFSKLKGIGEITFEKIKKKIVENYALCDLVVEYGGVFTISMLKKLYDKYPSIEKLKEELLKEPYKCLCGISGVGFITADQMLQRLVTDKIVDFGFDLKTSKQRCLACILYYLKKNEESGNTVANVTDLYNEIKKQVPLCKDHFAECIKDEHVQCMFENKKISLKKTYDSEMYIKDRMVEAVKIKNVWDFDIIKYKNADGFELSDEQIGALKMLCENTVSILNGPAGSGKTATTQTVIKMLEDNNKEYYLMAPTGRAAKVLHDYTKRPASTIHRALGYIPPKWSYNEDCQLYRDVVIVDEVSMVDTALMRHLLEAIDFKKTKLLLIGDNAQLPSVGCGNLLHDFLGSGVIARTTLTKIFRYGEGGLMKVATDVRMGKQYLNDINSKMTLFGLNKDYAFIQSDKDSIISDMIGLYKKLIKSGISVKDIQILSAYNKGDCGSVAINNRLQPIANPNYGSDQVMKVGETSYYKGDIVIQKVNNYRAKEYSDGYKEVFIANGEVGFITEVSYNTVKIDFDGLVVEYSKGDMNSVGLGYCISIHKSQGGSAKVVLLLTPSSHMFMLNSNILYVGLTRMKEKCYHFGDCNTINKAVRKKENVIRDTNMSWMLKANVWEG